MKKPKSTDPPKRQIPCECGAENCEMGLTIGKYPGDKIKLQIFEKDNIMTVVVAQNKLLEKLKWISSR